ncbi:unnamed protein product [Ceutorhynchus assimilis]|uniref:Cilia- and flagella-associated protein 91 n=1 Tax=Ceutorhynchus assimilis TaxID=467358 RepID=A0A9N9QRP0_9CUCU|nr:unnamed protein product [Ceutorhynchus assimilis]
MVYKSDTPHRPHDYKYDPIFTTSGPADHYKAAMLAKMSSLKYQVCPIFKNMFSELKHFPRLQLVPRQTKPIMTYEEKLKASKKAAADQALHQKPSVDVVGRDRAKFSCGVIKFPPPEFRGCLDHMPIFTIETGQNGEEAEESVTSGPRTVQIGTMYRDSYTLTTPWEPPYKVIGEGDPEILKLEFLKWGSGLPAGMHQIKLIERGRMKRCWEKTMQPNVTDDKYLQNLRDYVEAMEMDEWAFRESEIQEIQDLRLKLLEKMLEEVQERSNTRAKIKLDNLIQAKEKEKKIKLEKIRKDGARELRKIELQEKGFKRKYHQPDIVKEHIMKDSELYAPLTRHGEHPKRWHNVIDKSFIRYKAQYIGVESFCTMPRWLNKASLLKPKTKQRKDVAQLCIRETRWTAPVLKNLHEELLNLGKGNEKKGCSLRVRNVKEIEESTTPDAEYMSIERDREYQAEVFLQKIIDGRATQTCIYEGLENCRELIGELKHSVGLMKKQKEDRTKEKMRIRAQQREETIQSVMVCRLQGSLGKLQGQVVGSLLDFLNKELRRLLEERKAHAMCWVNERERNIREAAEAGRRQKEIRRRREHDEIFKQIVKITQESVEVYLNDIITEGMEFSSKDEAISYVLTVADTLEKKVDDTLNDRVKARKAVDVEEELMADMIHHFFLPEGVKQTIRDNIKAEQKQQMKTVHEAVHRKFENLPKIDHTQSWPESSVFSSSPTIEHYHLKLEEWLTAAAQDVASESMMGGSHLSDGSTTPLAGTIGQNIIFSGESAEAVLECRTDGSTTEVSSLDLVAEDNVGKSEENDQLSSEIEESGNNNFGSLRNLDTIPESEREISITSAASTEGLNDEGDVSN